MKTKNKSISFLGDSITAGANASSDNKAYPQILIKKGGFSHYFIDALGGTRIAKQKKPSTLERFDKDYIFRLEKWNKSADLILILGGTNDYGHGDAPFGELTDTNPYTFCGAVNTLFNLVEKKFPNSTIVVILPLKRLNDDNKWGEPGAKEHEVASLDEYSSVIEKVATKKDFYVCNLRKYKKLNPNIKKYNKKFFTDGLHPNDFGHKLLAEKILQFIKKI